MNYQLEPPSLWGWAKLIIGLISVGFIYICVVAGASIALSKLNTLFKAIELFFKS
jgi:hypothetical protein